MPNAVSSTTERDFVVTSAKTGSIIIITPTECMPICKQTLKIGPKKAGRRNALSGGGARG